MVFEVEFDELFAVFHSRRHLSLANNATSSCPVQLRYLLRHASQAFELVS